MLSFIRVPVIGWLMTLFLLVAAPAQATVSVNQRAVSAISGAPAFDYLDSSAVLLEHTLMPPGSRFQAYAFSDLSSGAMRASATADILDTTAGCCQYGATLSSPSMTDHFTLSGGTTGQVSRLDILFEGAISKHALSPTFNCCGDARHAAEAVLRVSVHSFTSGQTWSLAQVLQDNGCWARTDPCATGTQVQLVRQLEFPVLRGEYQIDLSLNLYAAYGYTVDFLNTARFYLNKPPNVNLQSTSGALFATATPVPEPATALLLLVGAAGCLAKIRVGRNRV